MRENAPVSTVESVQHQRNWEYLVITVAPHESLPEARQRLIEHSEYGRWELQRSLLYRGGVRRFWLRRKLIKVQSTLNSY